MQAKPEDLDTPQKRGVFTVAIVGCTREGVLQACLFAEAGFQVVCIDFDQTVVNQLVRGKAPSQGSEVESKLKDHVKTARIRATTDLKTTISQSDIAVVTVPPRVDSKGRPNYSDVEKACRQVGSSLRRGSLVILSGTTGGNEDPLKDLLENTSGFGVGIEIGLAYAPLSVRHVQTLEAMQNHGRVVAASDKSSLKAASLVLATLGPSPIRRTEDVKAAKAATLFDAVHESVSSALASEFATLCENEGLDYNEVRKFMDHSDSQPSSFPKLKDDETRTETSVLLDDAENLNVKLRIPSAAKVVNAEGAGHVAGLVRDALQDCGKPLRRARISLLGISQTPNACGIPKNAAIELAENLEAKGAKVCMYDPHIAAESTETPHRFRKNLNEALEAIDCVVILTGHDQFRRLNPRKLKAMMKTPAAVVDCEWIFEPDKIEKEGLVYRGLGRGVWKK